SVTCVRECGRFAPAGHALVGALAPDVALVQLLQDHAGAPAGERLVPGDAGDVGAGALGVVRHGLGAGREPESLHALDVEGAVVGGVGRIGPVVHQRAE